MENEFAWDIPVTPTSESTNAIEQFFEAQKRAKELQQSAIKELLADREKYEAAIEQIDQRLLLAGYEVVKHLNGVANPEPKTLMQTVKKAVTQKAAPASNGKKRVFSAETRAKMKKAQKARWAKIKKAS